MMDELPGRVVVVEMGDSPIFTRVEIAGQIVPVTSAIVESIAREDESVLVLRIPMRFVDLEDEG